MDTKSGPTAEVLPPQVGVIGLAPRPGKTPWWVRRAGLKYSHIVLRIGEWVWSQPWNGRGRCVSVEQYLREAGPDRQYVEVQILVGNHDPDAFAWACDAVAGRKSQRIRTVLRHLRLWPRPVWNCTTPVRYFLTALGLPVYGESPDAIIEELTTGFDSDGDDQSLFG